MGMFDDVRCEVPLPDGFTGGAFQTKSLDCEMDQYAILADGTLAIERFDLEELPRDQWAHPDPSHPLHAFGHHKRVNHRWEPVDFHGILNFYGMEGTPREPGYAWHEYNAKFTDGKLVSIAVPSPRGDEGIAIGGAA